MEKAQHKGSLPDVEDPERDGRIASPDGVDPREKFNKKTARVGVLGLGYVGLPSAVEYAD